MEVRWHASPNFGARRDGLQPTLIVIHYTGMESCNAALERLRDPVAEVSSHYLISEKGDVIQLVEEDKRAWHAGEGEWCGKQDINSRSIGIELDNTGKTPFSEPLMAALETLMPDIMKRWDISALGVIGHSDMAPGRKFDPGPKFDWRRLSRQGLAIRGGYDFGPDDGTPDLFRRLAREFGYTADVDDEALLEAVRLRFRPWHRGPLCPDDFSPIGHTALWT